MPSFRKIMPVLRVRDMSKSIDWYQRNLEFTLCWVCLVVGGGENCMLKGDEITLMLSTGSHLGTEPQFSGTLYFEMRDVKELFARLKEKVEIVWPLEQMDYGTIEFGIRDLDGYTLAFSEPANSKQKAVKKALPATDERFFALTKRFGILDDSEQMLTPEAINDLTELLHQLVQNTSAIGAIIAGHDGSLIASTMLREVESESLAAWGLGMFMNTEHVIQRLGHKRIHQIICKTRHSYVVLADFGGGLLIAVSDGEDLHEVPLVNHLL